MRRIVCREFGPPDRLTVEEAPDPRPGPGEVLVGVRAAGVSFVDGLIVAGMYQMKPPLPFTPGLVAAGEVAACRAMTCPACPPAAGWWAAGSGLGGYASHRVLPADAVVPLPDAVSCEVAATAVESYATMLFALTRRTSVRPGEWVLVLGAGGGIGLAAVDVASSLGARVIAAAVQPGQAGRGAHRRGAGHDRLPDRGPEGPGPGDHRRRRQPGHRPGRRPVRRARAAQPARGWPLPGRRVRGRLHPAAAAQPRPAGQPHA